MKKFSIILIVIALLVVVGANWFLARTNPAEPVAAVERDNTTIRRTNKGEVVGFIGDHGARSWLGIPFATAPVGELRWRAPQPAQPWEGVAEALAAGPMCAQLSSLLSEPEDSPDASPDDNPASNSGEAAATVGGEDCLFLNVWSPPNAQNLPVMLWIHGGGNSIGHGGSYNGSRLAVDERVVVISINYRLGVLGWFNHAALDNGNPADRSGNYGTLDIVRALEWAKANIGAFGGNPNNVTLFGESAGAFDTLAMMASPLAKDLFHRAIVQSGGFEVTELNHARQAQADGGHPNSSKELIAALMVADGTASDKDSARARHDDMPTLALKDYLYSKSVEEMYAVLDGGGFGMVNLPDNFGDGYVLPQLNNEAIFGNADNHNMVPTILGTNRDEPALFMVRDPYWVKNLLGFLPRLKDEDAYLRAVKYGALSWKERGVDRLARLMTAAGNQQVFAYRFDWDELPSIMGYDLSTALGAAHGLEIAFVFGDFEGGMNLGYLYEEAENKDELAQAMMGYWSEFARSGNPSKGNGRTALWQPWGNQGQTALLLDSQPDGIRMMDEEVTLAGIKTMLAADPQVASQAERCTLYANNFRGATFDEQEYASLGTQVGGSGCADYPAAEMRRF